MRHGASQRHHHLDCGPSPLYSSPQPTHPASPTRAAKLACLCTDKHQYHRRSRAKTHHAQKAAHQRAKRRPSHWAAGQSAEPQSRRARGRRARGPPSQKAQRAPSQRAPSQRAAEPEGRRARGPQSQRTHAHPRTPTHTRAHLHTRTQRAKPRTHAHSQPRPASHQQREPKWCRSGPWHSPVLADGSTVGPAKCRGAQGTLGAPPLRFW